MDVPSIEGYVVCVTVSGGNTDASSSADHRSARPEATRYSVGGASNEPTVRNAVSPSVSTDWTLINPSSSIAGESAVGVPHLDGVDCSRARHHQKLIAEAGRAGDSTTSRSATTVRHSQGLSSGAAKTRPFGASREVTPYNSPAWKKNDDCASTPLITSRHSPVVGVEQLGVDPTPADQHVHEQVATVVAGQHVGPGLGGRQRVEHHRVVGRVGAEAMEVHVAVVGCRLPDSGGTRTRSCRAARRSTRRGCLGSSRRGAGPCLPRSPTACSLPCRPR